MIPRRTKSASMSPCSIERRSTALVAVMVLVWIVFVQTAGADGTGTREESPDKGVADTGEMGTVGGHLDCAGRALQAPEGEPTRRQKRTAKKLVKRAGKQCKREKYEACADSYARAYEKDGEVGHLRQLGQIYRIMGDLPGAICAYSQFVDVGSRVVKSAAAEGGGDGEEQADAKVAKVSEELSEIKNALDSLRAEWKVAQETQVKVASTLRQAEQVDCGEWQLHAPKGKVTRAARRRAKKHRKVAERLHRDRDYRGASAEYREAYTLDGDPRHLRALGSVHESAESGTAALCSYRGYLAIMAEGGDLAVSEEKVLQEKIARLHDIREELEKRRKARAKIVKQVAAAIDCKRWTLRAPPRPSARARAKASRFFSKAAQLCDQRLYAECAENLTRCYEADGNAQHLNNLAWVYEQIGTRESDEAAICHYRQFLAIKGAPRRQAGARAKLASLSQRYDDDRRKERELEEKQRRWQEEEKARREAEGIAKREKAERQKAEKEAAEKGVALTQVQGKVDEAATWLAKEGASTKGTTRRHIGVGLAAAGGVSVGAGMLYLYRARRDGRALSAVETWNTHFDDLVQEGKRWNTRGAVLTTAGGAALLTGVAVYYWGVRASKEVEVQLGVGRGAGGAGATVWVNGSF